MNDLDPNRSHVDARHLPRIKRRVFAGICVALPLLALAAVECGLRLAGWGGQVPIIREVARTPRGALMVTDPEGVRPYFFAGPRGQAGSAVTGHFWSPKPEGTRRVFLVGGSAVQGFPQPRHLRVSAFLQAMLKDVWPERTIEVLNFGTTAVASYPVSDILHQVLPHQPDLVVIYSGHNEFYGAYGMASSHRAGSRPWMQRLQHRLRNLALVQAARAAVDRSQPREAGNLMEVMIGQSRVEPGDWRREAAARSLRRNLERMIRQCRDAGVLSVVCTLPANEGDLAPIGEADLDALGSDAVQTLKTASRDWRTDPDGVAASLESLTTSSPGLAHPHFYLGKALQARGDVAAAAGHFVRARDLDPMPWRAPSRIQQAIREAAAGEDVLLCDVEAFFRAHSEGGIIGWALMDDHVHPSLRGQALVAEAVVRSLTGLPGPLRLDPAALEQLRSFDEYADRLGDNPYDRYGVRRWLVKIFSIPFMKRANPEAVRRIEEQARAFEQVQPPYLLAPLRQWRSTPPICLEVALAMMRQGRHRDALPLLGIAGRAVAPYASGHLACTYYELACTEVLRGELSAEDRSRAGEAIARGELMSRGGFPNEGTRERFMGRLHYLRKEYVRAIPYLQTSRSQATGSSRVADDQALFQCYRRTGQSAPARRLADAGARFGGPFAPVYKGWLAELEAGSPPAGPEGAGE